MLSWDIFDAEGNLVTSIVADENFIQNVIISQNPTFTYKQIEGITPPAPSPPLTDNDLFVAGLRGKIIEEYIPAQFPEEP